MLCYSAAATPTARNIPTIHSVNFPLAYRKRGSYKHRRSTGSVSFKKKMEKLNKIFVHYFGLQSQKKAMILLIHRRRFDSLFWIFFGVPFNKCIVLNYYKWLHFVYWKLIKCRIYMGICWDMFGGQVALKTKKMLNCGKISHPSQVYIILHSTVNLIKTVLLYAFHGCSTVWSLRGTAGLLTFDHIPQATHML